MHLRAVCLRSGAKQMGERSMKLMRLPVAGPAYLADVVYMVGLQYFDRGVMRGMRSERED